MLCELLLSSLWFLFVIFWLETISVWLFLCIFYQDQAFYYRGYGVFGDDPSQMLNMLNRVDTNYRVDTRSYRVHTSMQRSVLLMN